MGSRDEGLGVTGWAPTAVWPDDLLHAGDLTCTALEELLDLAARMAEDPAEWVDALRATSVACLFETPDTRAGLSTEAAAHRLGMEPIRIHPSEIGLPDGERIDDAVRILSAYARAIVTRDVPDTRLHDIARHAAVPVINARSPEQHPTQAIADLFTLRRRFGTLDGLVAAYIGPATNVCASLMQACALASIQLRIACPPEHTPSVEDLTAGRVLADRHGGRIDVTADPREAVDGAHAVYAAPWPAEGAGAAARPRDALLSYQVTTPLLHHARADAVFLHCLPVQRGREVTAGVLEDRRRSLVWQQAANRLPVDQAILYALAVGSAPGP